MGEFTASQRRHLITPNLLATNSKNQATMAAN